MRSFFVQGRKFVALIISGNHDEFDAMEVFEIIDGTRGELLLEFRMRDDSAHLSYTRPEIEIPLLRASLEIFREEFFEPRRAAGVTLPPW